MCLLETQKTMATMANVLYFLLELIDKNIYFS